MTQNPQKTIVWEHTKNVYSIHFLILRYFEFWNDWICEFYKGNSKKPFVEWCWGFQVAFQRGNSSFVSRDFRLFSLILTHNSPGEHWMWFPTVITEPRSSPHDLEQIKLWFPVPKPTATNFSFSAPLLFSYHSSIPRTLTVGILLVNDMIL